MNTPLLKRNQTGSQDSTSAPEEEHYGSYYRYPSSFQPGHFSSLEKLMFFVSSVLLILLFIFVGLYARSSTHSSPGTLPPLPSPTPSLCLSPGCVQTAADILRSLDPSQDPCLDFYTFACQASLDRPSSGREAETQARIRYRLHQLLSTPPATKLSLPDPEQVLDRQLFSTLQQFYHTCLSSPGQLNDLYPLFRRLRSPNSLQVLAEHGVWALFRLEHGPDSLRAPDRTALYLRPPPTVSASEAEIAALLGRLFGQDTEFGWQAWSAVAAARRLAAFEQGWTTSPTALRAWTLTELEQWVPQIAWALFIPRGQPVLAPTSVLRRLQSQAKIEGHALEVYLIWRTLWTYLDTLTPSGDCLARVQRSWLGPLLGRYFLLDRVWPWQSAAQEAARVVAMLRAQLGSYPAYQAKLDRLRLEIGYGSRARIDALDLLSLTRAYGELNMTGSSLTVNTLRLARAAYRQAVQEQGLDWIQPPAFDPTSTRIQYRYEYNQVILPAGVLLMTRFDPAQPDYLYQSTLGELLAQAVMLAFDHQGRKYNPDRLLGPAQPPFKAERCLVAQYASLGLNTTYTLDQDLADHQALLYRANSNLSLPGLTHWTPAQLFYLQFARLHCAPHSLSNTTTPNRFRVNLPLRNSFHFAHTFQCKPGVFMHPKEKCQIW